MSDKSLLSHIRRSWHPSYPENKRLGSHADKQFNALRAFVRQSLVPKDMKFGDALVKKPFLNIGVDDGILAMLIFFDLKDIAIGSNKDKIDGLMEWALGFLKVHHFDTVRCRIDNGNPDEYYFNEHGRDPLYSDLI